MCVRERERERESIPMSIYLAPRSWHKGRQRTRAGTLNIDHANALDRGRVWRRGKLVRKGKHVVSRRAAREA